MNRLNKYVVTTLFPLIFTPLVSLAFNAESSDNPSYAVEMTPNIEDIDILAIDDEIKNIVDTHIRPIRNRIKRAKALHFVLFHPSQLGISYDATKTKTAQETFETRSGNCLSHASLYVAAARYAGLKARFQTVIVPRDWEQQEGFYIIPGHVNVVVDLPANSKAVIEFVSTYIGQDFKTKLITDTRALAEYYNNIGMEALEKRDFARAIGFMEKASHTYPRLDFIWSNLGVAYKINGDLEKAEQAYLRSLKINKRNLSTINNIYILYSQTGRQDQAEQYAKKAEKYAKKNPYHLAKVAKSSFMLENYELASRYYKKAARIKPYEDAFHFGLAKSYFMMGKYKLSKEAMIAAKNATEVKSKADRYQRKIDAILAYHKNAGSNRQLN